MERSTLKKRITTGVAALISQNGEAKCGGAVVSKTKKTQDANFQNMNARKMMKMRVMLKRSYRVS